MKHLNYLNNLENKLRKQFGDIQIRIDINFEDTDEEEFYFFINPDNKYCIYAFNDDCGYGIGLHFKNPIHSYAYYFDELGIGDQEKNIEKILIDALMGEKIFVDTDDDKNYSITFSIDFSKYTSYGTNLYGFETYTRYSIYDINNRND